MIQTTPTGHEHMLRAVTNMLFAVHLFVHEGELSGFGYESEKLDPLKWDDGVHPDILWEFEAADTPVRVLGYYVTDANGSIMYSENFPASAENEDEEPGFVIGRQGDRIAVGLRLNLFVASASAQT
jgi:hypothetical protein